MLGVGPQEIGVIALFALIIFGPGKLPEVMREAGKHYRKFKGMADQMTGELNKVTSEARKELDGALGEMGPMGEDLEKSLGMGKSGRTTSTGKKTTSTSSSRKSSTAGGKKSTGSSSSRTTAAGSKTTGAKKTSTSTVGQPKPRAKVASKEDPLADFAIFEGEKKETRRRSRSATPSAITDLTPRDMFDEEDSQEDDKVAAGIATPVADLANSDDPVARARARRRSAGYARV